MSIKNPIDLFDKDYFQNVKKVEFDQFYKNDPEKILNTYFFFHKFINHI